MKNTTEKTLLRLMIVGTIWFVYSSFAQAKIDDFEGLIQDSQKSTHELHTQLQKEAGIEFDKSKPGTIDKEKLKAPREAEHIVVSSKGDIIPAREKVKNTNDSQDMNRLSQELKDLQ